MVGIYRITNQIGQVYIGQSIDLLNRIRNYEKSRLGFKMTNSFKEYGFINHKIEVIEECHYLELNDRERYWQLKYDSIEKGLNHILTLPGIKPVPEDSVLKIELRDKLENLYDNIRITEIRKSAVLINKKHEENLTNKKQ